MKNMSFMLFKSFARLLITALAIIVTMSSCEDVIDVDLPATESRLAIDALIRMPEDESVIALRIRAQETTSFFEEPRPAVLDYIEIVNLTTGGSVMLDENFTIPGGYEGVTSRDFLTDDLELRFGYDGRDFSAQYTYVPSVSLDPLEQGDGILFDEEDTEVVIRFTDDGSRNDYYLFDLDFFEYLTTLDTFYQGQDFSFSYFYEDLQPGDTVNVSLMGIDRPFYNYMNQIIDQSGQNGGGGPFPVPPASVRGNIVEVGVENPDPRTTVLGYFAVVNSSSQSLIIQ